MRLTLPLAAAALAAAATSQTIVVPNFPASYAVAEAPSSTGYPWGRGTGQIRVQYVYDATHFTSQGITYPILVNNLRWRANGGTAVAGYTYNAATVQMSTAAVDYLAPSTTFASNHGPDLATVYSGSVVVASGAATTPNNWYVNIPVTPFLYDPTSGNDLCIDMSHDGTGPAVTSGPAHDCAFVATDLTSRIYNLTNYLSPTGTIQQNVSLVMEVGYNPASGLFAGFSANVTAGASPLAVNFTDSSFSSDPGGITGWAWDFDGDNVIDSLLQNPSFVYNNCGDFNVSLTVTDAAHPPSTMTRTAYIKTDEIVANFTHALFASPNIFQFTDTTTPAATSWDWDFNGDNITDSTLQNPVWPMPVCAASTVRLIATRACRSSTRTRTVFVSPATLTTTYFSTNGGATGYGVFFDLAVTNPQGISICAFDNNMSSVVGTAYTVNVYVTPGTHAGVSTTPAAWRLVGTGAGQSAGTGIASTSPLASPVYLPAGNYGMAIYYTGASMRYEGTNTVPPVQNVWTNADLTLTGGIVHTTLFGGTLFTPRLWNGAIHYDTVGLGATAGYGFFGRGCAGSMGVTNMLHANRPQIGTTLTVNLNNLPLSAAIQMIGFSNTTSVFGALPIDVTPYGAPGCFGRVSTDATQLLLGAGNAASWTFTVPNDGGLIGLLIYNQALVLDTGWNALGAVLSDATGMMIGN